jgi:hypothetical protein
MRQYAYASNYDYPYDASNPSTDDSENFAGSGRSMFSRRYGFAGNYRTDLFDRSGYGSSCGCCENTNLLDLLIIGAVAAGAAILIRQLVNNGRRKREIDWTGKID